MADYKKTVALEIGAQSVTMGVFTPAGESFELTRYARRDIVLDPVEEGTRLDYVNHAIGELVEELNLRGSDVRCVVSGQQVLMRFLKLPALDDMDLAEQVGMEAQQHIPFAPEDIIYSYQELPEREPGEREVLLVAIKKDVLDELNSHVEGNKLHTAGVDCAITSLYNAFRLSYPEDAEESVMILDIGAKTTDIIFADSGRFFTRSVTAAGSFITTNIAREFNISFSDAEKLKVENGIISLGNGHTDSMNEQDATLATTIRSAMSRLSSEVQRTINHFRAQYKGNPPTKAYICGGGAKLPYMQEFLNSTLNIPVEFLNPIAGFSLGREVDEESIEMDALCLGAIAGAAVTGAAAGEFNIDLVPTSVGKDRAEKKLIPKVLLAGVLAVAGAGYLAYSTSAQATAAQQQLEQAQKTEARLSRINDNVERASSEFKKQRESMKAVGNLLQARTIYPRLLQEVMDSTSSTAYWLTEFSPMINYTPENTELTDKEPDTQTSKRLIDMKRSISNGPGSARNTVDTEQKGSKKAAPQVTAVYITGFSFKKYNAGNGKFEVNQAPLQALVTTPFPGSLVSIKTDFSKAHLGNFIRFGGNAGKDDKKTEYAEPFRLLLPLGTGIAIPELAD